MYNTVICTCAVYIKPGREISFYYTPCYRSKTNRNSRANAIVFGRSRGDKSGDGDGRAEFYFPSSPAPSFKRILLYYYHYYYYYYFSQSSRFFSTLFLRPKQSYDVVSVTPKLNARIHTPHLRTDVYFTIRIIPVYPARKCKCTECTERTV